MVRAASLAAALLLLGATLAAAQQGGAGWAPLGPGIAASSVRALVLAGDGTLYAGQADPAGVWAWNGAAWGRLGPGDTGSVYAVALAPDAPMPGAGRVYAGGGFNELGGARSEGVAVWDGALWSGLRGGVYWQRPDGTFQFGEVHTLLPNPTGGVYVGGFLNRAGPLGSGIPVGLVASWDGTAWSAVGGAGLDGPRTTFGPEVRAMVIGPDGRLYVGGNFTTADGQPVANVAAFDPANPDTGWDDLGGGLPDEFGLGALAFGPDGRLYAAGGIGVVAGRETDLAAWDGTAWAPVGPELETPATGAAGALAFSADGKLYAGGNFDLPDGTHEVARLDGYLTGPGAGTWVGLDGGVSSQLPAARVVRALAVGLEGEVYVGGFFDAVGPEGATIPASNVAVWLGDRVVGAESPVEAGALALSVSPNPSHGAASVSVTLVSPSPVRIVLADVLGRTVAVVHDGPLSAGRHRLALPPSFTPGVYAVRVSSSEASATARWVVAR